MSDSVRPHRQQPTRLLCPWDSPGKNTGVGCQFLLQCTNVKEWSLFPVISKWRTQKGFCAREPHRSCSQYQLEPQYLSSQSLGTHLWIILQNMIPVPDRNPPEGRTPDLYHIHLVGALFGSVILLKIVFPDTELCFEWKGEKKKSAHNHLERLFFAAHD